jgi:hypothetical protein
VDLLDQMAQLVESVREDYGKAKGGNKAAGTRVRKTMQDVKKMAPEIRQEMLESRDGEGS